MAFLQKKELDWLERMDVSVQAGPSTATILQSEGEPSNEVGQENEDINPEDDFKREMHL